VIFPAVEDADQSTITIVGRQEAVEAAKAELEKRVVSLVSVLLQ
jgi:hypothetical protein